MKKKLSYALIRNPYKMPLNWEYVQPEVEMMAIPRICSESEKNEALAAFLETPGYRGIPSDQVERLTQKAEQEKGLRVILICDQLRSAQMCAARLCGLKLYGTFEQNTLGGDVLTCLGFGMLKSSVCGNKQEEWIESSGQIIFGANDPSACINNQWVDMLSAINKEERNIFVALLPGQQNRQLIHRLQFEQGYDVWQITENDNLYQSTVLWQCLMAQDFVSGNIVSEIPCIVQALQDYRGDQYSEWDLYQLIRNVKRKGKKATAKELNKIITDWKFNSKAAQNELEQLIGLESVKQQVHRILAVQQLSHRRRRQGKSVIQTHNNLAFSGAPGTCKSVVARLMARIMQEQGYGTGAYVEAGREDLIGEYLGQTSPKIAQLFERAKGGVLFIDEAGALVKQEKDLYVAEAVNALVRHMEIELDTMVIFATYPDDMKDLLATNPGLSSRISRVLEFPSYTQKELWQIFVYLAEQQGFCVEDDCMKECEEFFQKLQKKKGKNFGNGREARRLLDAAIEELALTCQENEEVSMDRITKTIMERAQDLLLEQSGNLNER